MIERFKSFLYNTLKIDKEDNSIKKGAKLLGQSISIVICMAVGIAMLILVLTLDTDDD